MCSENEHCWHEVARHTHTGGTTVNRKCCHCGIVRTETLPPYEGRGYTHRPAEHGPFIQHIGKWT